MREESFRQRESRATTVESLSPSTPLGSLCVPNKTYQSSHDLGGAGAWRPFRCGLEGAPLGERQRCSGSICRSSDRVSAVGLLAEPQSLTGPRHEAGHVRTLRPLQSRRASAVPLLAAPLRLQPRHRSQAAVGLRPLHRQLEQRSPQFSGRHNPGSHPPYSRRRRRALLPTGTCRSLRDSLRFSALSPELPELRSLSTRRPDSLAHQPGPRRSPATAGLRRVRDPSPPTVVDPSVGPVLSARLGGPAPRATA